MIQLINVNKSYDNRLILQDLNLEIYPGNVIGLVGPNGAGKSTILRLIAGVVHADAGIVAINDLDVIDNASIKQHIYFLSDEPYFFNQATLFEMKSYHKIMYKNFDETYYEETLKVFEINENAPLSSLSKGMKRQAALLLALSCKPEILLMDESFDALDPLMRFVIKQCIIDQVEEKQMIVIISSHNLNEIQDLCNQIILISNKGIEMSQSIETLKSSYHKFQIVFDSPQSQEIFHDFDPVSLSGTSQIFTLIIKGVYDDIKLKLDALNPRIVEYASMSLDEIYRSEMGGDK